MLSMFPLHVRALIFVLIGLGLYWALLRLCRAQLPDSNRLLIAWVVITAAAFLSPGFFVFSIVLLAVVLWLRPESDLDRVVLFVALLPVILKADYLIPGVAGINYLFKLDYVRLLTLFLLVPAAFGIGRPGSYPCVTPGARSLAIDFFMVALLFWTWVASFRETSITDGLRLFFDASVFVALPYFVMSRALRSEADFQRVLVALAFSAMAVACIAMLEQRATWWFHSFLLERLSRGVGGIWFATEFRDGLMRVKGTVGGGLGYLMMLGIAALWIVHRFTPNRRLVVAGTLLMVLCIWFTGARALLLSIALFAVLNVGFFFRFFGSRARFVLVLVTGMMLLPQAIRLMASFQDEYGTFSYRLILLESSIPLIWKEFLFGYGSMQALERSGDLEHMRQGEGIIDIVNHYLWIGLLSGGLALTLFFGLLLSSVLGVLGARPAELHRAETFQGSLRRSLVTLLLCTALLIATVSVTGHYNDYLLLLIALAASYVRVYGRPEGTPFRSSPSIQEGIRNRKHGRDRPRGWGASQQR